MDNRVFLSHSSKDKEAVRRLAEDLKRAGIDVWLDEWEIKVGDRITQKIQKGLEDARYLAVWLTRQAVESGWVENEWQIMYDEEISSRSTVILTLLAEDCTVPRLLRGKRYADFRKDYTQGLTDVLKAIGIEVWENKLGIKFALIIPGAFQMGSEGKEEELGTPRADENEFPAHQARINRPFYMSIYTITQAQWKTVMNTEKWKKGDPRYREGDDYPVVNVTWYDVQEFLTKLSTIDNKNSYYLPSEEEWEYAARAGTSTLFSFGDEPRDLRSYGWYRDMTQGGEEYAHPVGTKKPNPWGLYDMHGNVWEWTDSWYYGSYAAKPMLTPIEKVLRGGAWDYPPFGARSSFRQHLLPTRTDATVGFRLIKSGS